MKILRLVGSIFGAVAVLLLGLSYMFYIQTQDFMRKAAAAEGRIVDTVIETHSSSSGKSMIYKSSLLTVDPQPYLPGDYVTIKVHDTRPRRYWMDTSFLPEDP